MEIVNDVQKITEIKLQSIKLKIRSSQRKGKFHSRSVEKKWVKDKDNSSIAEFQFNIFFAIICDMLLIISVNAFIQLCDYNWSRK